MSHFSKTQKLLVYFGVVIFIATVFAAFVFAIQSFRIKAVKLIFVEPDIIVNTKNSLGEVNSEKKFYFDETIETKDVLTQINFKNGFIISNTKGSLDIKKDDGEISFGLFYLNLSSPYSIIANEKRVTLNAGYNGFFDSQTETLYTISGTGSFNSVEFNEDNIVLITTDTISQSELDRSSIANSVRLKNFLNNISKFETLSSFWTDFAAPELFEISPENEAVLTKNIVTVTLKTEPGTKIYLASLQVGSADGNGDFSFTTSLKSGVNNLMIFLEDELQNSNTVELKLIWETNPASGPVSYSP